MTPEQAAAKLVQLADVLVKLRTRVERAVRPPNKPTSEVEAGVMPRSRRGG